LPAEQELVYYKRLFMQKGRPIAIIRSWISQHLVPDVQLLNVLYEAPIIVVSSISYLAENQPLEYSNTSWVGKQYPTLTLAFGWGIRII